ncbi:GDP-mannose-dependent alpha-(1-6)-phosphatidylinositol monomannoside mannosyltransferase [Candidatus Brocadiaceae bacterium B188]|nr:glycosyltransferase family 4 protein [Candidatus Brocadia sapporoensis]QQR65587.1 MAG: glycosyltransferase family 4 protein [Candidatus Brocadia sp.]RZV59914.1 MAG: glycosyltransferase family 1 protein [Candidatus Brocadia sp. BROELEC01]TWU49888.1 GDP-mannose-dependent alpha-(1-6)-phosphatidylinositol monomannoside mannosyltransferase [Candidatus Brocadiaceae bacterium B188]
MKVLFITKDFFPDTGGVASFIHHLADQLGRRGHAVYVLAPRKSGFEKITPEYYRIFWCPRWKRLASVPFIFYSIFLALTRRAEKVFMGHVMSTYGLGGLILRLLFGIPYIILTHGNDLRYSSSTKLDEKVVRCLLNNASLVLCNSQFTKEILRKMGYCGMVEILNPGVDIEKYRPTIINSEIIKKYHLDGKKVILSVSRLVKRKGHEYVLQALPIIIEQIPNIFYLIVGKGEQENHLKMMVNNLKIAQSVMLVGYIDEKDLPILYNLCDVFVMPSYELNDGKDYEGFGIVYIEANACGKPVIGGRSGGVADAVIDGKTGLLVEPHNIDEIAGAIIRLLNNTELARRMGENGRLRVEKELSWEILGERLANFLRNIYK